MMGAGIIRSVAWRASIHIARTVLHTAILARAKQCRETTKSMINGSVNARLHVPKLMLQHARQRTINRDSDRRYQPCVSVEKMQVACTPLVQLKSHHASGVANTVSGQFRNDRNASSYFICVRRSEPNLQIIPELCKMIRHLMPKLMPKN